MSNDYEKIVNRIKKENIELVKKNSYGKQHYTYDVEVNAFTQDVSRRYITEPMYPECSINRQAHFLAHELGHHFISVNRGEKARRFFAWVGKDTSFNLITFPFVIYEEYRAWGIAKKICQEENINTDFFSYSMSSGINTYWGDYKHQIYSFIKKFIMSYIWCVLIVLFFFMTNAADIRLVSVLSDIQQFIGADETNKTAVVNGLFQLVILGAVVRWILKIFIGKKVDYQFVSGNQKKELKEK